MFKRFAVVAFVAFFAIGFGMTVLTPDTAWAGDDPCDDDCTRVQCVVEPQCPPP